ncbi:MAG: hypothetical protein OXH99_12655 [Bryobacterales bacterium]|nr:hypothetical protein [Bryobacterales bacterium]
MATFPVLSRKGLAQTICEHLLWRTPAGGNGIAAALGLPAVESYLDSWDRGFQFRNIS